MFNLLFKRERGEPLEAQAPPASAELPALAGADLAGMIQGRRRGGDFYHFLRVSQRRVLFGLFDVAGRHAENHAIVGTARDTFQHVGNEKFSNDDVNEADAMMEFCLELNLTILRAAGQVRACAAFLGCYNEDLGTVCYVNAGHTPGLLRMGCEITELPATGLPLGLLNAATYEAPTIAVPAGASLLLVSRGVTEASYKKHEFGLERVKQNFERLPLVTASQLTEQLLRAVREYVREAPTHNDVTTFALIRPATSKAAAHGA
jgi:serine phosphatase RsbU (regulator of sigma subunit)